MDIIQRTVELFGSLVQKIKSVGEILKSEFLPVIEENDTIGKLFYIFGW